jgi:alpha-glucosidase
MVKLSERLLSFKAMSGQSLVDDILATGENFKRADQRHTQPKPDGNLKWRIMGSVEAVISTERGLRVGCEQGWVDFAWLASNCVHVRQDASPAGFDNYFSYAVHKTDWAAVRRELIEQDDCLIVTTDACVYRIWKYPLRLSVETLDGREICADSPGIQKREDGAVRLSMRLHTDESCHGLGERAASLNLRGRRYQLWNWDPPTAYQRGSDPLYYSIPFYLGVRDHAVYGLFWDNSSRGLADVGEETAAELTFEAETGPFSYYLFAGGDVNSVLARYTELTGRIWLPPVWFLGYQQCRWSYYPQETVLRLGREFRERGIPCDVIYLDIHYMHGYRVFTWDRERFPEFEQMIASLHNQGFKVVAIVDPGIKVDPLYATFQSGVENDVFVKYPDGERVAAAVWPGMCHFPDFTKPAVRDWWAQQCQQILQAGIDGLWNDMCEPATFLPEAAGSLPDYACHDQEGQGGDHRQNHNVYGMQMARATQQGLLMQRPDARPVNMLRAGYAGTQRYAASWTGDNSSTWEHLRLSISMALNMGLSGAPMTGPDVGGFFGNADGELFTRWLQAACLMPYYRGHSALGTGPHEPWAFGQPYEVINRMTIELRYRLLPYLYSVVAQAAEYGWPVIRPVFMAEPDNSALRTLDDSYLLGDGLLVAPVLEQGAVSRSVYLPDGGDWYDFWTNERFSGGQQIEVTAPLERLPLFVKAGTVLPMWPVMQYVGEKLIDGLTLRLYPGSHETVLYEDAGEGQGYQQGEYRWVYITATQEDDQLTVNRRVAGGYEPAYKTIHLEIVGLRDEPHAIRVDRHGAPVWFYDEDLLEVQVDSFKTVEITLKPSSSDRTLPTRPW